MSNASDKIRQVHPRQARVRNLAREEMSELGRDLFDLSREYESSGEELLTEKEIEVELVRRRGGYVQAHAT